MMPKKGMFIIFVAIGVFFAIFIPSFLKLQKLKNINQDLTERMEQLRIENTKLLNESARLKQDPVYIEKIARQKMKIGKKGEVVYKVSGE